MARKAVEVRDEFELLWPAALGLIAQLVERTADNGEVDGPNPSGPI